MSQKTTGSDVGFVLLFLVIVLIAVGLYTASPHMVIVALIAGGVRMLWNKVTGGGT